MSRDIRSYFQANPSKKGENVATKKTKEPQSSKRKKKAIIDSDSDDEVFSSKTKLTSTSVLESKRTKIEKPDVEEPKAETKLINVSEVFGSAPVKRISRKVSSKDHDIRGDPETIKALQDVAETEWDLTVIQENGSMEKKQKNSEKIEKEISVVSQNVNTKAISPEHSSPTSSGSSDKTFTQSAKHISPLKSSPSPKKQKILPTEVDSCNPMSSTFSSQEIDVAHKKHTFEKSKSHTLASFQSVPVSQLWVDKYKPSSLKQIIGQQGENCNVKKLLRWLSAWHSNHGSGVNKKLIKPSPWSRDDSGSYFKAALLSGPPGVGKTTTAHLVCKELGMDVVEFNASDTRSKRLMNEEVTELLSSKTLLPFFQDGKGSKTSAKHVLLMDEVDGMAGNEDRGGVQELISLIKNSKCPVICMCNDRNHAKIRSLANYCFDLRFYKPRIEQIKGAMMSVCFKEKIQISPEALNEVIAATNCDIRQVLHNLSMWSSTEKKLNTEQTKNDAHVAKKHIKLGPWDTVKSIFSADDHSKMSLIEKADLFFNDYNIMPLFVQENYLMASPRTAKNSSQTLRLIARAASSISYGDLIEKTIRSRNDAWSLLPVQAIYSSVAPGELLEGRIAGQIQFPSWLGKNSTYGKMNRILQELQSHMRLSVSGGKQAVNLDYIAILQKAIVNPLEKNGAEGVQETLSIIREYQFSLGDLENLFELCQWQGQPHPMSRVESKVKAALTRAYNKSGIMAPYACVKKRKATATPLDEEEEASAEVDEKDSGSDSDEAEDAMIKVKKHDSSAKTTASTSRASRGGKGNSTQGSGGRSRGRGRGRGKK